MAKIEELEKMVNSINSLTESPMTQYVNDGKSYIPQPGNYHLDFAYGGVSLHRMAEGGGVIDISNRRCTKRELKLFLSGFLSALRR